MRLLIPPVSLQMRLVLLKRGSRQPLYLTLLTQDLRLFALYEKVRQLLRRIVGWGGGTMRHRMAPDLRGLSALLDHLFLPPPPPLSTSSRRGSRNCLCHCLCCCSICWAAWRKITGRRWFLLPSCVSGPAETVSPTRRGNLMVTLRTDQRLSAFDNSSTCKYFREDALLCFQSEILPTFQIPQM